MNLRKLLLPMAMAIGALFAGPKAGATTCPNAISLPSTLPIVNQAVLCGTGNDITATNVIPASCGNTSYFGGLEALYTYTPTTTQTVSISYTGVTYVGIFVFAGCPTTAGTTCTGSITNTPTSKSLTVTLNAGTTYYVMFDTWPSPTSPCPGTFTITSCQPPTALASGSITPTSASISFTGTASNYQFEYGTSSTLGNASNTRVAVPASPYVISSLVQTTTYYTWVRSICAAGDTSSWSSSITFATTTACASPTAVTTTGLSTTGVTLGWTAPSAAPASGYRYEVRTSGAAGSGATGLVVTGITAAGVTTATVTGLTSSTAYSVYVQGNCGAAGYSNWTSAVNFTTLCNAVTAYPFIDTFIAVGLPPCWLATAGSSASQLWTGATSDASNGVAGPFASTAFIKLNVYSASTTYNPYVLNSRSYTLSGAAKQLQYYYFLGSTGYNGTTGATGSDPFPMMVLGTKDGGTTYDTLYSHSTANSTFATTSAVTNWTLNSIILPANYAGQTVQFRIVSRSNYGSGITNQALDQFTINDVPSCQTPTGVAISAISATGATITWTAPPAAPSNGYQYEVRSSGTAGSGATGLAAIGTTAAGVLTANVTGLTGNTSYNIFVRSNCGITNGFSAWTTGTSFTTLCTPTTIFPFVDTFVAVGLPTCWASLGASQLWTGATSDASNGVAGPFASTAFVKLNVYLASQSSNPYTLTSRSYTLSAPAKQLQYQYYLGNDGYKGTTGLTGTDPYPLMVLGTINGGISFDTLYRHNAGNSTFATTSAISNWTLNTIPLPTNYANQTVQFRFVSNSNYGSGFTNQALDEVTVMNAPLCTNPVVALGNDTAICSGNSTTLNAGNVGATYLWSTGATTQSVIVAATGSYSVRVTVAGGCIGRDTINVTVNPLPVVNLGLDMSICAGSTTTINAGNAGSTYLWNTGATTQSIIVSTAGAYSVRVTNAGGCIGRDTINISVNPLPVVALGNDTTICSGNSITLNAGNAGGTYLWSTGATTQTIASSMAGSYSVRVTNAIGCIGRDTINVIVSPLPVVALGNDVSICSGTSTTLNAGNAGSTYLWSTGATTQSVMVSTAGSYSVRVTNAGGCIGRDTLVVTVSPSPIVALGNDTAFCIGGAITLNAGNAGNTYLWSTGATTQTVAVSVSGAYSVKVTNAGGCIGRDTINVTVSPLPVVNLGNDTNFCIGSSVMLNAANAGSTYLWSTGATTQMIAVSTAGIYSVRVTNGTGCIGRDTVSVSARATPIQQLGNDTAFCAGGSVTLNAGNAGSTYLWSTGATTQTIIVSTIGTYSVRVTNTGGCIGRDTINVTAAPSPVVNLGADRNFCAGTSVILSAGNAGSTYLWSSGATSQTINVAGSGTYSVRVRNAAGCFGRDTVNVTVRPAPVAGNITVSGQSPIFSFVAMDSQNDSLRGWLFGDGTSSLNASQSGVTHTYTQPGTYKVKFYAANSCGVDTSRKTVVVTTVGVQSVMLDGDITLFPNPASNYFTVQNNSAQKLKTITVLNLVGAVVQEVAVYNNKEQRIAINGLAAGSYLVRITLDGATVIRRLQITQ